MDFDDFTMAEKQTVGDQPPHDKRSHKSQQKKRPFTADELNQRSLVRE
jgi:hypothetical protein